MIYILILHTDRCLSTLISGHKVKAGKLMKFCHEANKFVRFWNDIQQIFSALALIDST